MPKGGFRKGAGRPPGTRTRPESTNIRVSLESAEIVKETALELGKRGTEAADLLIQTGKKALISS